MPRTVSSSVTAGRAATASAPASALALALTLALAGCAPDAAEPSPSPSRSASASPSASPGGSPTGSPGASPTVPPSPAPTNTEGPGSPATPVGASCLDLVSLDTMYSFDPNFGLDDSYAPAGDGLGAVAVANGGIACGWVQQTSGEVIEIAAARPSESGLDQLRADAGAADGARVFSSVGGRGVVQAFAGSAWVVATSTYFGTADDAALLIDSALAALN